MMKKFTILTTTAVPLRMRDINTDIIFPGKFLRTIKRTGLEDCLFANLRFDENGDCKPDFILNNSDYQEAQILITEDNFGGGSSREHAVWALMDYGFRCVIAPSFGDIFFNNAPKSGMLLIQLPQDQIETLMKKSEDHPNRKLIINLEAQTVQVENSISFNFKIDPFRKHCLLNGLDDIGLTMEKNEKIQAFLKKDQLKRPWLYSGQ